MRRKLVHDTIKPSNAAFTWNQADGGDVLDATCCHGDVVVVYIK